jgi:phosphoribosylformylglycinamidine cyclo-ligase
VVGLVDNSKIIDGSDIRPGHQLIGLASSGLHSNGFSLVRKVCFEVLRLEVDSHVPELGRTLGEELLAPTRIYADTLHGLIRDLPIHGLAHITGGGIADNLLRIIPKACGVAVRLAAWDTPPIFDLIQKGGNVTDEEMLKTFNNGIGMIAVVPQDSAQEIMDRLKAMDEKAYFIGEVVELKQSTPRIQWV